MNNEIIKLLSLTKTTSDQKVILNDINFSVNSGEFVSIMGASGSGKSTLLNIIAGLDAEYSGEVDVAGVTFKNQNENQLADFRNEQVGIVFQEYNLINSLTVLENIRLPLYFSATKQNFATAEELAADLGLKDLLKKYPSQLSGGEQQRVSIARALIRQPKLLLADEPTGALDSKNSENIMQLFKEINRQFGTTIVMVTHDEEMASYSERIVRIHDGEIIGDAAL
ncbi:ABC transporter ATP-binding protein [Enterococcus sp. 669A]|uniref:ABC transporter ATP-binding protein n=1 Tax=Candidatus Enterococcus moelleringii TaxID=2815325 RepID=A0ABS3LCB4_9ENTE|nr:ABC transporter ATP-binding protein [Enterococcus sp. 669A]MBO1306049.1 ABC transporter ATP-binding protein [Enterococcus sp. 669A]